MKRFLTSSLVAIVALLGCLSLVPAQTAIAGPCQPPSPLFPRWFDDLCAADGKSIASPNELGGGAGSTQQTKDNFGKWLSILVLNLVKMLLFAVGYVSLAFIIYGGYKYMISGDNSSGTQAARKTITNAVIGLIISILSVAIVTFITSRL